jgi:plasmid stability protein
MFAIIDSILGYRQRRAMAAITIRNLEVALKERLRQRAAANGRSMEDEVREILRTTLASSGARAAHPADAIMARFGKLGGVELEAPVRGPLRAPPEFGK